MDRPMPRIKFRWIILILVIIAGGAAAFRYTRPKPIQVVVKPVEKGMVEKTAANTRAGTVNACRRAKLSPGIGGQIVKLPVKEGDRVEKGQLLLELWNEDIMEEARFAKKEADAMESRSGAACLRADIAQREADRFSELYKTKLISLEKMDRAMTEAKALKAECSASRASALMSRARMGVVQANLERTRLTAPFSGVIAEINGELNEYVTPSPVGIPTPPAVDLVDNTCFYVTAPMDEVDAPLIAVGMPARISLDAFREIHYEGRVRRVGVFVLDREKQARTVDVEVEDFGVGSGALLVSLGDSAFDMEIGGELIHDPQEGWIKHLPGLLNHVFWNPLIVGLGDSARDARQRVGIATQTDRQPDGVLEILRI